MNGATNDAASKKQCPTQQPPGQQLMDSDRWNARKANGTTESQLLAEQPFGPMIASYTRAQAIEDGVLVDLCESPELVGLVLEAGFKVPIAMRITAFERAIGPLNSDLPAGQSLKGRLWDVLMVLRMKIRMAKAKGSGETDRIHFKVSVAGGMDANGKISRRRQVVRVWSHIGPGDNGEPVITIMLEGED